MTASTPHLEIRTRRLALIALERSDETQLLDLFHTPEVKRYLLDDQEMPPEFAREVVEDSKASFAERGAGIWGIRVADADDRRSVAQLRRAEDLVGFVGYREFFDPPELQLLYGLHPSVWGRGYATEAAAAVVELAFTRLGFEAVVAATDPPNIASIEVMRRLGLHQRGVVERDGRPTVYAEISKKDWLARGMAK